jgi:phage terminase large subunit-like protein
MTAFPRTAVEFIDEVLINPETNEPFVLLPAQRAFLDRAFDVDEHGKLVYPEQCFSTPKKGGKTTFAAIVCLTAVMVNGESITAIGANYESAAGANPTISCFDELW